MNFQFYLEKLFASKNFSQFKKENKDAFPCSGFFTLDFEKENHQQHFDYFVPSTKKVFSFKIENNCEKVELERLENYVAQKLSMNYSFDFDNVIKLIKKKMEEEKVNNKIQKILLSLQKVNNDDILTGTIFLSNMAIIKISIDISELKITDFKKSSLMDMFKIINFGKDKK